MSAAVGITVSTTGYARTEDVLQDAAIALHRAKADGDALCELTTKYSISQLWRRIS